MNAKFSSQWCLALLAITVAVLAAVPAHATPAFARKYEASCQTCHVAYPKLNPFGNAFRRLGYHMPGETEGQVKQPEVSLGAEGYKRVWPKAIWPGKIPPQIPLALVSEWQIQTQSRVEVEDGEIHRELTQGDFVFPSEVALVVSGTAGDHVSYFGEIEFEQESEGGSIGTEVSVGHVDVRLIRPIKNSMAFNVKIGSFQPELVSTFDHARRLTITNYDSMFAVGPINAGGAETVGGGGHHGGGGGIALPAVVRGFDFYGVINHRFEWAAGFINGIEGGEESFDANSSKDYYLKASYKWGGLALDGANAEDYAANAKNWRENSFQVGAFYYDGNGEDIFFAQTHGEPPDVESLLIEDRDFDRTGVDFNWIWSDLNLFGAYVEGEDNLRAFLESVDEPGSPGDIEADASGQFEYSSWFVEADVVFPWPFLIGALRIESVDLPKIEDGEKVQDWERATVSLTGLVRANVKAIAEYTWDLNESKNYNIWLGASIAF